MITFYLITVKLYAYVKYATASLKFTKQTFFMRMGDDTEPTNTVFDLSVFRK